MTRITTVPERISSTRLAREVVLHVDGLVVDYAGVRAVDGIDFEVRRGEVFGLLGTNGAGKTTTLDVLEGFRAPTSGAVRVFGVDPLVERDRISPRMGIMLQDAGFFEDLTVRQTVRSWRRFYARPRGVEETLQMVGLEHRATVRVKQLSGGERRRLDLGLALLGHPEVLFLDEPTTGMDPEGRHRCLQIVRDLVEEGLTVVLTTHYLEEAEQLADRVAIMHRGRIRTQGTLDEVLAAHRTSVIRFELDPARVTEAALTALMWSPGAHVQRSATTTAVSIDSADPQADLGRLLAAADRTGVALDALTVTRSSLEDLFLALADEAAPTQGVPA
ncbi:ABC transporter ATP-binding protein [Microbacterium trichothecenolyticum]|uniref:ABC-2 type transport system ATP-binding protein n=1 Tax=Microbacterium trichothecenolyticum TaxID=69370 RepID=A0ABU0TX50_MICTR|nr:ABC transporter ATP-binding protein [Microbacterium trichothecenolyticum]MDQ1124237.1 ABC-2 type transport system ATP-binding protein [Microbacterium trichothecenolyticum]